MCRKHRRRIFWCALLAGDLLVGMVFASGAIMMPHTGWASSNAGDIIASNHARAFVIESETAGENLSNFTLLVEQTIQSAGQSAGTYTNAYSTSGSCNLAGGDQMSAPVPPLLSAICAVASYTVTSSGITGQIFTWGVPAWGSQEFQLAGLTSNAATGMGMTQFDSKIARYVAIQAGLSGATAGLSLPTGEISYIASNNGPASAGSLSAPPAIPQSTAVAAYAPVLLFSFSG